MKKKYNKPTVEIMEIEGNNVICGSCAESNSLTIVNNKRLQNFLLRFVDGADNSEQDGEVSRTEIDCCFGVQDDCTRKVDRYCKFQSVDGFKVAWS